MATLKKYDLSGKETGKVEIDKDLLTAANGQMIKDYIVAIRKNARQWSANTKDRSEVNKNKQKPHPQKGLGRARQGSYAAPQYKGGGIVFGPKPKKDMHTRINQKEKRKAVRSILSDHINDGSVYVLECTEIKEPKTKTIANFLNSLEIKGKRVLFLGPESKQKNPNIGFIKSMRNIEKTEFMQSKNINGYDLSLAKHIIVLDEALEEFMTILGK